jgi:hypothetical protein
VANDAMCAFRYLLGGLKASTSLLKMGRKLVRSLRRRRIDQGAIFFVRPVHKDRRDRYTWTWCQIYITHDTTEVSCIGWFICLATTHLHPGRFKELPEESMYSDKTRGKPKVH